MTGWLLGSGVFVLYLFLAGFTRNVVHHRPGHRHRDNAGGGPLYVCETAAVLWVFIVPFLIIAVVFRTGMKAEQLRPSQRRVRRDNAIVAAHKEIYGKENP